MALLRIASIDRTLIAPKVFYFLFFAAMVSLTPFLTLYYEQIGLSGRQIGLLAGIPPLMTLVGAPVLGGLADATRQHKRLLQVAIVSSLLAVLAVSVTTTFVWLIPAVVLYAFFFAPIIPLADNNALDLLGDRKRQYGRQRIWGAFGWGSAAMMVGLLAQRGGLKWAFYGFFFFMVGTLLVSSRMSIGQAGVRQQFWRSLRLLLTNWQWPIFLALVFTGGMSLSIIRNYLFLYMNELGASKTLMGLSLTIATVSEWPILFFSDRLLRRLGSRGLLLLALLAFSLRTFAYSLAQTPQLMLAVQLLHGPTFAAMWIAGVAYANELAPAGMGATAQGLFSGVTLGLGSAFGAIIGGWLYEYLGCMLMFQWAGMGMMFGVAFLALADRWTNTVAPS